MVQCSGSEYQGVRQGSSGLVVCMGFINLWSLGLSLRTLPVGRPAKLDPRIYTDEMLYNFIMKISRQQEPKLKLKP